MRASSGLLFRHFPLYPEESIQSLPASFGVSYIAMFAVLLFLLLSASHVHHAVNGLPANTLALLQFNETDSVSGYRNDTLQPSISDFLYVKPPLQSL